MNANRSPWQTNRTRDGRRPIPPFFPVIREPMTPRYALPRLRAICCLLFVAASAIGAQGQPFSFDLRRNDLSNSIWGRAFPADLDGDGDADLVISGAAAPDAAGPQLTVARYGAGTNPDLAVSFEETGLDSPLWLGDAAWSDVNRDGRLDLLVTGLRDMEPGALGTAAAPRTTLFLMQADGSLRAAESGLPPRYAGAVAFADFDRDGDRDLALSGLDEDGVPRTDVYRLRSDGTFEPTGADLPQLALGDLAWADPDGDGDLDLALSGIDASGRFQSVLATRDGDSFRVVRELEPLGYSSLDWGDYDGDGDADLVLTGGRVSRSYQMAGVTRIYRNDGGTLVEIEHRVPGVFAGSARWGDLDQDGDLDLAVTGLRTFLGDPVAVILENRSGVFSTLATLPGAYGGSLSPADVDGDGDLDLILTGQDATTVGFVRVVTNVSRIANHPPAAPESLSSTVQGRSVTLSWTPAKDAATPIPVLTYEVRVGTATGLGDVMAAFADPSSGARRVWSAGNAGASSSLVLHDLPAGTYSWTVQTIDSGFQGSLFAPEAGFAVAGGKAGSTATDGLDLPSRFDVAAAWPNPFSTETAVDVDVPTSGRLTVDVYDVRGRRIATVHDAVVAAGRHRIGWSGSTDDGASVAAGVFAFVVRTDRQQMTRFVVHLHE